MKNLIAIDCGGTNLRVALVDESMNILSVRREPTILNNAEELSNRMIALIKDIANEKQLKKIDSIGISYCGLVIDNKMGNAKNLGVSSYDIESKMLKAFPKTKFLICNDANCAALAEARYGAGKEVKDFAFVTISTGIGIGVVHNHKMLDMSLENGRSVMEYKGKFYESENLLSGKGIPNLAALNDLQVENAESFFNLVKEKDTKALFVYNEWLKLLGMWFANLQLAFNTDVFLLSGGVLKNGEVFLEDLERVANAYVTMWQFKPIVLKNAKFLQDVGIIGAGALAVDALKGNKSED